MVTNYEIKMLPSCTINIELECYLFQVYLFVGLRCNANIFVRML